MLCTPAGDETSLQTNIPICTYYGLDGDKIREEFTLRQRSDNCPQTLNDIYFIYMGCNFIICYQIKWSTKNVWTCSISPDRGFDGVCFMLVWTRESLRRAFCQHTPNNDVTRFKFWYFILSKASTRVKQGRCTEWYLQL